MEFRELTSFVMLATYLNFSKAAYALHESQPALSKQIASLEKELGVKLVDRDSRPLSLTGVGRMFLKDAKRILQARDDALQKAREFRNIIPYRLRLGAAMHYTPTAHLIADVIEELRNAPPPPWISRLFPILRSHCLTA